MVQNTMNTNPIDISNSESAKEAAKRTRYKLKDLAEEIGQKGDVEVSLRQEDNQWIVSWPGGPSDWTMKLTGGLGVFGGDPNITGFGYQDEFIAEVKNSYSLVFTPQE